MNWAPTIGHEIISSCWQKNIRAAKCPKTGRSCWRNSEERSLAPFSPKNPTRSPFPTLDQQQAGAPDRKHPISHPFPHPLRLDRFVFPQPTLWDSPSRLAPPAAGAAVAAEKLSAYSYQQNNGKYKGGKGRFWGGGRG